MKVCEAAGYLVESMDPAYRAAGEPLVGWVSSPAPERMILGTGRGATPAEAARAAVADWMGKPVERLTTREERIGAELLRLVG